MLFEIRYRKQTVIGGSRNGRAKSDGSEPVEFEWAVITRSVQVLGLIDFAAFSRLAV